MRVLIIETTPATPHAETALELGIKESRSGSEVIYCPIFHLLPKLLWASNINGHARNDRKNTVYEWIDYLIDIIAPFATTEVLDFKNINIDPEIGSIISTPFDFIYDNQQLGKLVYGQLNPKNPPPPPLPTFSLCVSFITIFSEGCLLL